VTGQILQVPNERLARSRRYRSNGANCWILTVINVAFYSEETNLGLLDGQDFVISDDLDVDLLLPPLA
jgi:hypothetical protein